MIKHVLHEYSTTGVHVVDKGIVTVSTASDQFAAAIQASFCKSIQNIEPNKTQTVHNTSPNW